MHQAIKSKDRKTQTQTHIGAGHEITERGWSSEVRPLRWRTQRVVSAGLGYGQRWAGLRSALGWAIVGTGLGLRSALGWGWGFDRPWAGAGASVGAGLGYGRRWAGAGASVGIGLGLKQQVVPYRSELDDGGGDFERVELERNER
ncbi:hypothetical protein CFP56_035499 [Quercus suber]|uniref:Uncharacterized protein n=1 Tax=Quercus suber TaxID=58331 RepID=A0AAW0LS60_QUESU